MRPIIKLLKIQSLFINNSCLQNFNKNLRFFILLRFILFFLAIHSFRGLFILHKTICITSEETFHGLL